MRGHWMYACALTAVLFTSSASAQSAEATAEPNAEAPTSSEQLIYSVTRTPERMFDTPRDVEVITQDEILDANVQNLGQLLERRVGITVINGESGTMPLVRGLGGKQVMFLIDGVKVNNATWRGAAKEYLYIFDVAQIERIEIVRGVVSVLGTESLGGVINIITKKGAPAKNGKIIQTTLTSRYASGENATGSSVAASAAFGNLRVRGGFSFADAGEVDGGGNVDEQPLTGYKQLGGYVNGEWLLSTEKTVSFAYQNFRADNVETPGTGSLREGRFDPAQVQLLSASYHDLTDRSWEDSFKVTAYLNRQRDIRDVVSTSAGTLRTGHEHDENQLAGLNLELGTFIGAHHFVYGADLTAEKIDSTRIRTIVSTGVKTPDRGNFVDGATYRSLGLYVQHNADWGRRISTVAGLRGSRFEANGDENSAVGVYTVDAKRSTLTGSLSVIGHITPQLNLVANVVKGYRAPNLDDLMFSGGKPGTFTIPNPQLDPEKVLSVEGGVKYQAQRVQGTLFYFRNSFTNYIVAAPALLNGLPFRDTNNNGVRDAGESLILQNQNVGEATIHGFETTVSVELPANLSFFGQFSRLIGRNEAADAPLTLMPPASGAATLRYSPRGTTRPWAELGVRWSQAQRRLSATDIANVYIGPNGAEAYQVVDLRGGVTLFEQLRVTLALENLLDETYHSIMSNRFQPGRQVVIGTQWTF